MLTTYAKLSDVAALPRRIGLEASRLVVAPQAERRPPEDCLRLDVELYARLKRLTLADLNP